MSICFCASGCGRNSMADPGVFGSDCSCWCHDRKRTNPYDAAREWFERAGQNLADIRKTSLVLTRMAEEEYDAAEANLRKHETKPGIPKPEYRQEVPA